MCIPSLKKFLIDLWPSVPKKKCTLTYTVFSLDELLPGDSRIFCIYESEVRFGFNPIFSEQSARFLHR